MNILQVWKHFFSLRLIARRGRTNSVVLVAVIGTALLVPRVASAVSIAYSDPPGGWTYAYTGDAAAGGTSATTDPPVEDALDGKWDRTSGGDSWGGDAIGGAPFQVAVAPTNAPGGISALSESSTNYIRIQDTGDPREAPALLVDGGVNPANVGSNRRVFVGHNLAGEGVGAADAFLDTGITLSFRARIATAATNALIDPQYPDLDPSTTNTGGENRAIAQGTAWQAGGNGELVHDGGKGNFNIRQATGDKIISFSMGLNTDIQSDGSTLFPTTGLNMNSLNGTAPSGSVDPFQNVLGTEGTLNVLAVPDLTEWHEYWITIRASVAANGEGGTHRVAVYRDGSTTPNIFFVTAGNGNDYTGNYLGMGSGATPQQNAFDVDFFAYKIGYIPAPEPGSMVLIGLGCLGLLGVRRRK